MAVKKPAPSKWKKLPSRSRTKCREMVLDVKRKKVYIIRCPKRATWKYGKVPFGVRCDDHKEWVDKVAKYAAEAVSKVLK